MLSLYHWSVAAKLEIKLELVIWPHRTVCAWPFLEHAVAYIYLAIMLS